MLNGHRPTIVPGSLGASASGTVLAVFAIAASAVLAGHLDLFWLGVHGGWRGFDWLDLLGGNVGTGMGWRRWSIGIKLMALYTITT